MACEHEHFKRIGVRDWIRQCTYCRNRTRFPWRKMIKCESCGDVYHVKCLTVSDPSTFSGWDGFDLEYAIRLDAEASREACGVLEDGKPLNQPASGEPFLGTTNLVNAEDLNGQQLIQPTLESSLVTINAVCAEEIDANEKPLNQPTRDEPSVGTTNLNQPTRDEPSVGTTNLVCAQEMETVK